MAGLLRRGNLFPSRSPSSRLQALMSKLRKRNHSSTEEEEVTPTVDIEPVASFKRGSFNPSDWKTIDSRAVGIRRSAISSPAWTVLSILQRKGYQAYLVGGCVRDLLLKRIPKDFDVITTASLKQIRRQFNRCMIIGRRFPICQVHLQGSIIEVSSFITSHINRKQKLDHFQVSCECNENDILRWENSMKRDFTVNSLFFDPIGYTIYDYVGGIRDIKSSKLRTVIPAYLSFKEDYARILRGIRVVARLGLQISKETADAIWDLSSSIATLNKTRLVMELNFMLSYGAAESSMRLLQNFKLLDILLPIHAAYLADQSRRQPFQNSVMLMRLLSNADKLLAADRPADCSLWLALLTFHLALVENPQDALVLSAFSALLYHGNWEEALAFARENVKNHLKFVPEVRLSSEPKSDELLLKETSHLASLVKSSVKALINMNALQESIERFGVAPPPSCLVFVSEKMGKNVARLFDVIENDIESYKGTRRKYEINYKLLQKGDAEEIRFALGRIMIDTILGEPLHVPDEDFADTEKSHQRLSALFK